MHKRWQYNKNWYKLNRERRNEYFRVRRAAMVDLLNEYKMQCGCVYCHNNSLALEFHHVGSEKVANVCRLVCRSWENIKTEIDKCEVVCANCHAIITKGRKRNERKN